MEIKEFVEETQDLEEFFSKDLKEFERKIWYEELKNMPLHRYRQLIHEACKKCKYMPKLADIILLNNELSYSTKEKKQIEHEDCKKCNGVGVIFYKKIIDGFEYDFVARCDCNNGQNYAYDGRKVSDPKNRSNYYIPTLEQINLKGA